MPGEPVVTRDLQAHQPRENGRQFPVVGIGIAAGGLEALRSLLPQLPASDGMAFLVMLPVASLQEGELAACLQQGCAVPVVPVQDAQALEADRVYLLDGSARFSMDDNALRLQPDAAPDADAPPALDRFFRNLAQAFGERAIAVVLPGHRGDGTAGLARVREAGGVTIAEAPAEAGDTALAGAARASGQIDIQLPVAAMAARLRELSQSLRQLRVPAVLPSLPSLPSVPDTLAAAHQDEAALAGVLAALRLQTHHDFRHYKRATLLRRVTRRLQIHGQPDLPAYHRFLEATPGEAALLLQDLFIGVTHFFRDREAFEVLEADVIPTLFDGKGLDEPLRVWVVGCATGEEAYSVAMLLREACERLSQPPDFQVFATDIDRRAIATARAGVYPGAIAAEVGPARLARHFVREGDAWRVAGALREKVLFATHNVLHDPPFSRLDLVCCRNLLIYLERRAQISVLEAFRFALRPNRALFLGQSESPDATPEAFSAFSKKHRLYRSVAAPRAGRPLLPAWAAGTGRDAPPARPAAETPDPAPSHAELHRRALESWLPPSVLIDAHGDILNLSDGAGRYLEHRSGPPSPKLLANVSPALRQDLVNALHAARQSQQNITLRHLRTDRSGVVRRIQLSVRPLTSQAGADLVLIVFDEMPQPPSDPAAAADRPDGPRVDELERDNRALKEQLQNTIEQAQVSVEEMKASNEELQAINEELRSATEELVTSREELRSTNEELGVVNLELKAKVREAGLIHDDLLNFVAAGEIATVFVGRQLEVMRFTPQAAQLFHLIASDIGRSLLDINHKLDYPGLADDARLSFESMQVIETSVRATDGRLFLARFLPYRTAEEKIGGAVLSFVDVSALHDAREQLRAGEQRLRLAAEATRDFAIVTLDAAGRVTAWNAGAGRLYQWTEAEILGRHLSVVFTGEDRAAGLPAAEMRIALEQGRAEDERWHQRKDGSLFFASGVMTPLPGDTEKGFAKIVRDTTELKQLSLTKELLLTQEHALREQVQTTSNLKDEFLAIMSHELKQPLSLIHGHAELLSRMPEAREIPQVARAGQAIQHAVRSQARIIDDLLDLSRMRTRTLGLRTAELLLLPVVAAVARAAATDAQARGVVLTLECSAEPLLLEADRMRLEQIVRNLLSNAIKFTPAGGKVVVRLDRQPESGMARLVVQDTGRGIDPDFLPEIFGMFSQEAGGRDLGDRGLGIGLALVKELVVAHGGLVAADSPGVGSGSVFTVLLPTVTPRGEGLAPSAERAGRSLQGLRLLLVDDSVETLEIFSQLLRDEDAIVNIASTGEAALKLLAMGSYDVLLADLGMPAMNGYELIARVRRLHLRTQPYALALSGHGRQSDVQRALEAGFDAHLSKPASIDSLKAALRDID